MSAFATNLQAYNDSEINSPLDNSIDFPSEAFLDFLASGIDVELHNKSTASRIKASTQFIDPMEIQELDNLGLLNSLGLLTKLKLPLTITKPIQSNNLTKENKE